MENDIDKKTYELAYHLVPTLDEATLDAQSQDIEKLITQQGGFIIGAKKPQKTRLSYPIKHQKSSYFGVINFNAAPETITHLNPSMKLNSNVMRYLILNKEGATTEAQQVAIQQSLEIDSKPAGSDKTVKAPPADQKQIEAAIDDVLSKIN